VIIRGGNSTIGSTGDVSIQGGQSTSTGTAGGIFLQSGNSFGAGGLLILRAGSGAPNGYVALGTGGWDRVWVTGTGNVGIGTSNPVSKFQVVGGDVGLGDGTATGNQPVTIWLTNSSGGTRVAGEIVVASPTTNNAFTITTTASSTSILGVVYDASISAGAAGRIAIAGIVPVLTAGTGAIRGQHVVTSTTSGRAGTTAAPASGASIGRWLEFVAGAGTAQALLD